MTDQNEIDWVPVLRWSMIAVAVACLIAMYLVANAAGWF